MDSTAMQHPMELRDFLLVLRRRRVQFVVPFILIILVGLALAFGLPPVYRSEATILIEKQEIPTDLIQTTVTGYVEERIKSLTERLMTADNLWKIVKTQNLYPGEHAPENRRDIVQRMQDSIFVEMVDVKTNDPGSGKQSSATIAFTIAFEAATPEDAQKVTRELTALYLEENRKTRSEQAAEVSSFLEEEAEKLNKEISELEAKLAEFKQEKKDQLPELWDVNLKLFEKAEEDIDGTKEQIRSLQDNINALQAELDITSPYQDLRTEAGTTIQAPAERLRALMAEYVRLSTVYSPDHPDLKKIKNEIASLENQVGGGGDVNKLFTEYSLMRSKLLSARQKYSDEHPDVKRLKQAVAGLESKISEVQISDATNANELVVSPDNPRYVSLKTQLDSAIGNLKVEKARLNQLNLKLAEYERRLFETPAVERDFKTLARDYDNAQTKYQELKEKQLQARLAEQLEAGAQAEQLVVIQPAFLPITPDRPNRLGIALLGGFLAFSGGIGAISVAEYMDRTIRGSRGIISVFQAPPLAVIPLIRENRGSGRKPELTLKQA